MLRYHLSFRDRAAHRIWVSAKISTPAKQGQRFSLACWAPGSYLLREFAKNILSLEAFQAGQPVLLAKIDNSTWECMEPLKEEPLEIVYELYAWDDSVRGAHVDTTHAFFEGSRVFLRIHGQEQQPAQVRCSDLAPHWRVATSMPPLLKEPGYQVQNYEALIDHPFEIGSWEEQRFEVAGVPHHLVISGQHYGDAQRLARDLARICHAQHQLWGEPNPLKEPLQPYYFLLSLSAKNYGGLEHRSSSANQVSRYHMPSPHMEKCSDAYIELLGLLSHEYFHLWNIKRIKPAVFFPYDLSQKAFTQQLWAFEGITSYYDDLALLKAGVIEEKDYWTLLEKMITRVKKTPGQFRQSVAESSWDAWTKFYQTDENTPNAVISYYAKGALIALCLDLSIRQYTRQSASLMTLMRRLWKEYGALQKGVPEGRIESLVLEVMALDPKNTFAVTMRQWLHKAQELPLKELLAMVGLDLQFKAVSGSEEKQAVWRGAGTWGCTFENQQNQWLIKQVYEGGEAQKVGLAAGDKLIALDGLVFSEASYDLMRQQVGLDRPLCCHVIRDDRLLSFELCFRALPMETAALVLHSEDDLGAVFRQAWLYG